MSSFSICCQNILTPNLTSANSALCCGILLPPAVTSSSVGASDCSQISCASYIPVCFTAVNSNLCGYLQGIDTAICNLKTSIANINCSAITVTGTFSCITGATSSQTLCAWATDVNNTFCTVFNYLQATTGGTGGATSPIGPQNNNPVTDGTNGTLTSTSGLTATNGTISATNNVVHGIATNSLKVTYTNLVTAAISVNTTTVIPVKAGQVYELKAFVYATSGHTPSGTASIIVNGTGTSVQVTTPSTATAGVWQAMVMRYTPDVTQNITITLNATNYSINQYVNFADLTMQPVTATNSGSWLEFEVPQFNDLARTYNNIASNFAPTLTYSTSGLNVTAGIDILVVNGKTIFTVQQTVALTPSTTNYLFYDTWTDTYVNKTVNAADSTQTLIYTLVTNGSVVTTKTISIPVAPFSGTNIQAASITGSNIAASTIASSNLVNTAVTAATYADSTHVGQFTVNAQGQLTAASSVAIAFPVTSVNSLTGAVSLGLGNLTNVVLTSPSNGQFLKYNGTNWVNASIASSYYQTVLSSISTTLTQRPNLNFNAYFTITDDNVNSCTTVSIATNGLTYDRIQQAVGGAVLLGNSSGATGNYSEQTVSTDLLLSSGQLSVNYVINTQSTATYSVLVADVNGSTAIFMTNSGTRTVTLPAANTVPIGRPITVKDGNGNAGANNITVNVTGGANIDGSATSVISSNYGRQKYVSNGTQWYTI